MVSNGTGISMLGRMFRRAGGGSALMGVFVLLGLCMGLGRIQCQPPPPCETNADCDDQDGCTGDVCDTTTGDCSNPPLCVDALCVDDACVECVADTDCDLGDACVDNVCEGPGCSENADCGDGDDCTTDACVDGTCANDPVAGCCATNDDCEAGETCENGTCVSAGCADDSECPVGEVCDAGTCVPAPECTTDDECGNSDDCDGVETCVEGACTDGTPVECAVDEVCVGGECQATCTDDADCADDADPCTDVACVDGSCATTDACDDGLDCTDDSCDADTGDCTHADNCPDGEQCGDDGACVEGVPCETDADCPDDGDFCNGDESCGADGFCESGPDPCDADETCNEALNECTPPEGVTIDFTLGVDNLSGTGGTDTFEALLAFNAPTGDNRATLQSSDRANGGDETDTLNVQLDADAAGANATLSPTLTAIEIWNINDFGTVGGFATTLSAINSTGLAEINSVNSTDDAVTVTNVNSVVDFGVSNSTSDLNVTFISPATNANNDSSTLTLNGARAGVTVNITTPVNGFETFNVASQGAAANVLDALTQTTGTTLTALNVSGSQKLTITAALNTTLTTVNASTATGDTNLNLTGNALNVIFTGGSGNDTVNFAAGYTTADTVNGGTGTNTLGLNAVQATVVTNQANVTGIQNIQIVDTLLGGNVDVTKFGATDAILDTTGAVLLLNLPSTVTLAAGNRTLTLNNDDVNDAMNTVVTGVGTADTLTVNVNNSDQSFAATAHTFTGAETVNFVSGNGSDGTAADGNVNQALNIILTPTIGTGTLNFTGSVAVTIAQGITSGVINAGALGGAFTHETTTGSLGVVGGSVIGSAFADELVGGTGNDGISGGDGNDQIKGNNGADILTGGGGTDRFFFDATTQFGDTLIDFTAATDKVGLGSGIVNFAGVAGTEAVPVPLVAANFETGRATVSAIAVGDTLKIVRVSGEQTTAQITTDVGGAANGYVLVFDSTIGRGVLYHDPDWSSAAGRALVARFENIITNAGVQALTFTDFEEID